VPPSTPLPLEPKPESASTVLTEVATLRRRMAAFFYEGILVFAVLFLGSYLYDSLTQHRHALIGRTGLQIFLFGLLGLYFIWFWTHGGQTLAMKTWHVRLVSVHGGAVSWWQAAWRYALAWLWFLPALLIAWVNRPTTPWVVAAALVTGLVAYAALTLAHPRRQFLHDVLVGSQLVKAALPKRP
jgi:uncharacterized RDD family membrane protein YckC